MKEFRDLMHHKIESEMDSGDVKSSKYLFMVRHGLRADHVEHCEGDFNKLDVPMTDEGFTQAQKTAIWIKEEICKLGVKKVKIICSPMIRAVQTAAIVAHELEVDQFDINNGYVEHLDPGCAKMHELEIRQNSEEELKSKFFKDITFVPFNDLNNDVEDIESRIPEDHPRAVKRIKEYLSKFIPEGDIEMTIIVTHAYAHDAFIELYGGERILTYECAVSAVEFNACANDSQNAKIIHNRHIVWS